MNTIQEKRLSPKAERYTRIRETLGKIEKKRESKKSLVASLSEAKFPKHIKLTELRSLKNL